MDSPSVEVVRNKPLEVWWDSKLHTDGMLEDNSKDEEEYSHYDKIYVDVTVSDSEKLLSPNIHKKLKKSHDK